MATKDGSKGNVEAIRRIIDTLNGFGQKAARNYVEGHEVKSYMVGSPRQTFTLGKPSGYDCALVVAVGKEGQDGYGVEISTYRFKLDGTCLDGGTVHASQEQARLISDLVTDIEGKAAA